MIWTVKIDHSGRVTIPAAIRQQLGLVRGSEVAFVQIGEGSVQLVKADDLAEAGMNELIQKKPPRKKWSPRQDYFLYQLDDYGTPPYYSGAKPYIGTIKDGFAMIEALGDNQLEELQNTFEHFAAGERGITHTVAYAKRRFAYRVSKRYEQEFEFDDLNYDFENAYGFYYTVRAARVVGKVCIFQHNRKFYTVLWAKIDKPMYADKKIDEKCWLPLGDMIWGHPGIIKVSVGSIENTLGIVEGLFDSEESAREHLQSLSNLNWNPYFSDIFGDG